LILAWLRTDVGGLSSDTRCERDDRPVSRRPCLQDDFCPTRCFTPLINGSDLPMFASNQLCRPGYLLLILAVSGCGAKSESPQTVQQIPVVQRDPASANLSRPLTPAEIEQFLLIISQLPGGQAPEYLPVEFAGLTSGTTLPAQIEQYRQAIRRAISPARQAAQWQQQPLLRSHLEQTGCSMEEFADLMLRVSSAWSASVVTSQATSPDIQQGIQQQIEQLQLELQRPDAKGFEAEQKLRILEELVAFSEFTRLLQQVPAESLLSISRARRELSQVMPESSWLNQATQGEQFQGIQQTSGNSF